MSVSCAATTAQIDVMECVHQRNETLSPRCKNSLESNDTLSGAPQQEHLVALHEIRRLSKETRQQPTLSLSLSLGDSGL